MKPGTKNVLLMLGGVLMLSENASETQKVVAGSLLSVGLFGFVNSKSGGGL